MNINQTASNNRNNNRNNNHFPENRLICIIPLPPSSPRQVRQSREERNNAVLRSYSQNTQNSVQVQQALEISSNPPVVSSGSVHLGQASKTSSVSAVNRAVTVPDEPLPNNQNATETQTCCTIS
jgi:hypothetical protein